MTTDNSMNSTNPVDESTYSKAASIGRTITSKPAEKASATLKTLSLRPTKSVKKNSSFKPVKKLR